MKKMIFLMLTLFVLSVASMNAQVTIGTTEDPHPSALLDLQSNTLGLKLPTVVLTNRTTFLAGGGDKMAAKGMLVYNTGTSFEGPGLYVWSGTSWMAVSTINCATPAVPEAITFSPALTGDIVQNTLITATVPLTNGATAYIWSVPAGLEIAGDATGRSVNIRATAVGSFNAADITVKSTNACSSSDPRAGVGTINVTGCSAAPAVPTLTIPNVRIDAGETVTVSCGDVGATSYTWTLPDGITASSTTTTTNSIVVTCTAEGYYYGNTFSVYAENACGESEVRTGTSGLITVQQCTEPPSDANIWFNASMSSCVRGTTFNAYATVTTEGATTYEWSLPAGLSIVSVTNSTAVIEATKVGDYKGSDITVKITNACGSVTAHGSGTIKVMDTGTQGTDLVGTNDTYATIKYPMGLGTWMNANSKEGNATHTAYSGHENEDRGYYYNNAAAPSACPWEGWSLPTYQQLTNLTSYLASTLSSVNAENESWVSSLAGRVTSSVGLYWNERMISRGTEGSYVYYNKVSNAFTRSNSNSNISSGYSVRCIKSEDDEAPYISFLSYLGPELPVGTPVKMFVTAGSTGTPSYQWSVPAGAVVDETFGTTSDTLVVTFHSSITFNGEQLSVSVTNAFGTSVKSYEGQYSVTTDLGHADNELVGDNGTYKTYVYPDGIGTWMIDFSKEGDPLVKQYTGHEEGERGYYYGRDELASACPMGYRLPASSESMRMLKYEHNLFSYYGISTNAYWKSPGHVGNSSAAWNGRTYMLDTTGYTGHGVDTAYGVWHMEEDYSSARKPVRCIKQ
jgi:hypothetical protein